MALGYDGRLYILAFDHRQSFLKTMFGIEGVPSAAEAERIADAKRLIFEGTLLAAQRSVAVGEMGVLIDEQFGSGVALEARRQGLKLAMPVERSGQREFEFEYGAEFAAHIERFDPDFAKVLVRYNPEGDSEINQRQLERLAGLSAWLREHGRKLMFEVLVPATDAQLASVGADVDTYDRELRPGLMGRAMGEIQDAGVEVDVWKIEGVESRADAELLSAQARSGAGRGGVACVVLGRGASIERVDHWLSQAASVGGFVGFAVGRSLWREALRGYLDGQTERTAAAADIAERFIQMIGLYERERPAVAT